MTSAKRKQELESYLARHPDTRFMEPLIADMNGILRGKRVANNQDGSRTLSLMTLPLRPSMQSGLGLDGIPGLITQGTPLVSTLRPLDGTSLVRGRFADEPEAEGQKGGPPASIGVS